MEEAVVGGEGAHHRGAASEGQQADAMSADLIDELGDVGLGAGEAIGRGVFGEHALGDIQDDHNVRANLASDGLHAPRRLRAHQRDDAEQQRRQHEHEPSDAALERRAFRQTHLHRRRHEAPQRIASAQIQVGERRHQRQRRPDAVYPSGIGENHSVHGGHGIRAKSVPRPSQPRAANKSAAKSGRLNNS